MRPRDQITGSRPTLLEAIRQYDTTPFIRAASINTSPLIHDVHPVTDKPGIGYAHCGAHGLIRTASLDGLVCLSCWPWWHASDHMAGAR